MAQQRPWYISVRSSLLRRLVTANVAGAVLILLYFNLTTPVYAGLTRTALFVSSFSFLAVSCALLVVVAILVARRVVYADLDWLAEDRDPTDKERDHLLAAPWLLSRFIFWFWFLAAIGTAVATIGSVFFYRLRLFIGVNLAGLSTLALSYLLVEQAMRPILAVALKTHAFTTTAAMSIRRRHTLAWALGSGIPIALIAVIPLGRHGPQYYPVAVPLVFMSGVALVAGSIVTVNLARSLAAPIDAVHHALGRVRTGDLSVEVAVNDAGELGHLQAGVNQMVAGLREREHLHDLFGRHVGEEVARQALERGTGLRAEQREVSVFFVDLVGSTALSESRTAEEVIEILNAVFAAVASAVRAEGGWINKFEGDAALCVFGAPSDQPDHADRALRAARALRDDLARLSLRYDGVAAGIGVSSGRVVAGNIGAEERYEYTVIGSPVNEAARLTDEAKRRETRLVASRATIERATDAASLWRSAGDIALRGLAAPTDVYEPVRG